MTAPASDRLPSLIAIPLRDYADEAHPVLRLHRLCDAVEILTRFCTVAALAEHRARLGDDALPPELLKALQEHVERPTFGRWVAMLRVLVQSLDRGAPLVLGELPDFVTQLLLPPLSGGDDAGTSLLALRNDLAHGGGMTRAAAEQLLRHWEPHLQPLLAALGFLADVDVCVYDGAVARRLTGPTARLGPERMLSADLRKALDDRGLAGHVVLLRGDRWLDLWPLCHYARAAVQTPQGLRPARADSPLVYYRAAPQRLTYLALGSDWPFGDGPQAAAEGFRRLFQLDRRAAQDGPPAVDFDDELRADAAALVGRRAELEKAVGLLKEAQTGVFWVGGRGGIGKSFLMARLCYEPKVRQEPRKALVVGWRFKASDQTRGNRAAFLRHAVTRVAEWLGRDDVTPAADPGELYGQLGKLLDAAAARAAPDPRGRSPRVLFFLDGLDEIDRLDPTFADVPFLLSRPNVVWVCAGRPEGRLPEVFRADRCTPVFGADGLPAMSDADIRALLLDETDALKYDLLRADREEASAVVNDVVRAVAERADGLPLYVHFVIEDILSGHFRFDELPDRLPPSLAAYFDDLLRRLSIGALQALLTPLVVTLAWAKAPLDEAALHELMVRRKVAVPGEKGRALLRRGLEAVQSMIRPAKAAGQGAVGYEPYHLSFREHIRRDEGEVIGQQNDLAREEFCALARECLSLPAGSPAREYALRHGVPTLLEAGRLDDVVRLLTDWHYLDAKAEAGLVKELAGDFTAVLAGLPREHPRYRLLELLEKPIREDIYFLSLHPKTLFHCLWNFYGENDRPHAAQQASPPPAGQPAARALREQDDTPERFLEQWRTEKARQSPAFRWLRTFRLIDVGRYAPNCLTFSPNGRWIALGDSFPDTTEVWDVATGEQTHFLFGHEGEVTALAWSPDSQFLASGSRDRSVKVWPIEGPENRPLWEWVCEENVTSLSFAPDGQRLAVGLSDGRVFIWSVPTGQLAVSMERGPGAVLCLAFSPDGCCLAGGSDEAVVQVWDSLSGKELRRLEDHDVLWDDPDPNYPGDFCEVSPYAEAVVANRSLRGVIQIAHSADGTRLASYGRDGKAIVRPAGGGPPVEESLLPHTDIVAVANPGAYDWLPVLDDPYPARHWRLTIRSNRTGETVAWVAGEIEYLRVHPGGRLIASLGAEGCVLFQLEGGT